VQAGTGYASEEAERLSHKHIGTEHLLLGLLREEKCLRRRFWPSAAEDRGDSRGIAAHHAREVQQQPQRAANRESSLLAEFSAPDQAR